MSTGIVYLRPSPVLFVRSRGLARVAAEQSWTTLLSWAEARAARGEIIRFFGLIRDHAGALDGADCRYDACIEAPPGLVEDNAGGVGMQMLPGGAYVRHRHTEGNDKVPDALAWLCKEWAPGRNMAVDVNRPMLEVYTSDPLRPANGRLRMDLCVPVSANVQRRVA